MKKVYQSNTDEERNKPNSKRRLADTGSGLFDDSSVLYGRGRQRHTLGVATASARGPFHLGPFGLGTAGKDWALPPAPSSVIAQPPTPPAAPAAAGVVGGVGSNAATGDDSVAMLMDRAPPAMVVSRTRNEEDVSTVSLPTVTTAMTGDQSNWSKSSSSSCSFSKIAASSVLTHSTFHSARTSDRSTANAGTRLSGDSSMNVSGESFGSCSRPSTSSTSSHTNSSALTAAFPRDHGFGTTAGAASAASAAGQVSASTGAMMSTPTAATSTECRPQPAFPQQHSFPMSNTPTVGVVHLPQQQRRQSDPSSNIIYATGRTSCDSESPSTMPSLSKAVPMPQNNDSSGMAKPSPPPLPPGPTPAQPNKNDNNNTKSSTAPKADLHAFFGKGSFRKVLSAEDYYTWHDGGPPHNLKWSSVFICPVTGEAFPSGRYGDPKFYRSSSAAGDQHEQADIDSTVVWYSKKTLAEHGAAARALDCLSYRESLLNGSPAPIRAGEDQPYPPDQAKALPPHMPAPEREKAQIAQERIRAMQRMGAGGPIFPMETDGDDRRRQHQQQQQQQPPQQQGQQQQHQQHQGQQQQQPQQQQQDHFRYHQQQQQRQPQPNYHRQQQQQQRYHHQHQHLQQQQPLSYNNFGGEPHSHQGTDNSFYGRNPGAGDAPFGRGAGNSYGASGSGWDAQYDRRRHH